MLEILKKDAIRYENLAARYSSKLNCISFVIVGTIIALNCVASALTKQNRSVQFTCVQKTAENGE